MTPELIRTFADSPAAFRRHLVIDADGRPRRLGDVMDPWQRADFEAMDSGWLYLAGRGPREGAMMRGYLERPRGHSKTNDIAVMVAWALSFSKRPLTGIVGASDRDQGRLIRDAVERLVRLNSWLSRLVCQQYKIVNDKTGSTLEILSADASSAYGSTPDFVLCDELTHWPAPALWDAIFSAAAKRTSLVLVISNAGTSMGSGWQWRVREAVRNSADWYFSRLDGPHASWITPDRLEEQKRLLPGPAYRRLWLNQWTSAAGDAMPEEAIDAAFRDGLGPLECFEPAFIFAAGLDLGLSKDSAGFAIVGKEHRTGRLRLAKLWTWKPSRVKRVDLADVEETIKTAHRRFHFTGGLADPFQGEYLLSRLAQDGVPLTPYSFGPANWDRLARNALNYFGEGSIALYPHAQLERELRNTSIVEMTGGRIKLSHPRNEDGHGDNAVALYLAMLAAVDAKQIYRGGRPVSRPGIPRNDPPIFRTIVPSSRRRE